MKQAQHKYRLHCVCHGVAFRLCADDPSLLEAMARVLPYSTRVIDATSEDDREFSLHAPSSDAPHLEEALDQLQSELMIHVADLCPDRVFLHAGVVGWRGRAIVFPGPSFAGKTTLIAELVKAGATYYSDEYAVLDAEGRVYPFTRDLQMRRPGSAAQRSVSPYAFSDRVGAAPLSVSQVYFAQYASDGAWNPVPVTNGMAILEMLRHAIPARRAPMRVLSTLNHMLCDATVARSQRGDAATTAALLLHQAHPTACCA